MTAGIEPLTPDTVCAPAGRRRGGLSRRHLLIGAGAGVASLGLASVPVASAQPSDGDIQQVINVASTIEVLTTVVTTTALARLSLPPAAVATVSAAAREELDHFQVLVGEFGGRPASQRVWVPDAVFTSPTSLFQTLVVGEQICINLYLLATTVWAGAGQPRLARVGAELVGNEAVHRALARDALGLQPNDRSFMKYSAPDQADGPGSGMLGFTTAYGAIKAFRAAGIGFGSPGASPGSFYDFASVRQNTPDPSFVNTRQPQ